MPSSGPNSPGTLANDASFGTNAWTDPGNAAASDDARATSSVDNTPTDTQYLMATNFGFAIATDATIDGITVEIERSVPGLGAARDRRVRIVKGGVIGATDKATADPWPSTGLEAYATYGGAADLWGETWTAADINASNFGMVIAAGTDAAPGTPSIDHIRITIDYTAATWTADDWGRVTIIKSIPVPPRGGAKAEFNTFGLLLEEPLPADEYPRGAIAPPTYVPRRNSASVHQAKLFDAGSTGEQESGWMGRAATPTRTASVGRQSRHVGQVDPPPIDSTPGTATWMTKEGPRQAPKRRGRDSLVSFVPLMQGPHFPSVSPQWVPRVTRYRGSKFYEAIEGPLQFPPRWSTATAKPCVVPLVRQSRVVNAFPEPQLWGGTVSATPTKFQTYRKSLAVRGSDPLNELLLLSPAAVRSRPIPLVLMRPSKVWALEEEPVAGSDIVLLSPSIAKPMRRILNFGWPQTRIMWCPQTIDTSVRKDDRDSVGTSVRGESSSGGSGRNRSSTGVGTGN